MPVHDGYGEVVTFAHCRGEGCADHSLQTFVSERYQAVPHDLEADGVKRCVGAIH